MHAPPVIRPITLDDAAAFRDCVDAVMRERLFMAYTEAFPLDRTTEFVAANLRSANPQLIAVDGNRVVGWCDVCRSEVPAYAHCGTLGMGVLDGWRGRGIGERLIRATLEEAAAHGFERVELGVYGRNTRARALYLKVGFVDEGIRVAGKKLDGVYDDVHMMAYRIQDHAMQFKRFSDLVSTGKVAGRRVFIRADLNVPQDDAGKITDDTRIRASAPAIRAALDAGAAVMVTSHLGRPTEGEYAEADSLAPVAQRLAEILGRDVPLRRDYLGGVAVAPGQVVLLENCRFNKGEKKNADELARQYAALCDIYVNDAFGTAHRAEASTHGVAKFAKIACAGPLLAAELDALGKALSRPKRPLVAIVAGSKVSTKLSILQSLAAKVDQLVVGGGIANTFLAAAGKPIGKSLSEPDLVGEARRIIAEMDARGAAVPIPVDVVCGKEFSATAAATVKDADEVAADDMIFDIGPKTAQMLAEKMRAAGTVVWNGPVGVFEFDQFGNGTRVLAEAIAASDAFSIAGGGDTLAAIAKYGVTDRISYISTGGGAFLEFLEGKPLPAVQILESRAAD